MVTHLRLGALGALLLIPTLYCACIEWRKARETAMFACASSIHAALISTGAEGSINVPAMGADWHVFSNLEKTSLLSVPSMSRRLDCHNFKTDDPHLHIAARRLPQDQRTEVIVWFDGADGLAGTSDDVSSVPGAKVPPSP